MLPFDLESHDGDPDLSTADQVERRGLSRTSLAASILTSTRKGTSRDC